MPEKIDSYSSYGQKLISLFARLLFSRESHSLTDLARMLHCSKQSVLRLVDDIRRAYGVDIEENMKGRRKYYQIKKVSRITPALNMTETEITMLQMCQAFTQHLLGKDDFNAVARAIEKSTALFPEDKKVPSSHFSSFQPGSVDYTPHQNTLRLLINAMEDKKICMVTYKSIWADRAKIFHIKPLKIFSYKDTLYLNSRLARAPGRKYKEPDFNPLLAIHRIQKVELTDRLFEFPTDYDFEKIFKNNFGIIKEDAFTVEIEFSGWSARYVSERIWSPDQKIVKQKDGKIKLAFTASSEPELLGWILSFGSEAKVLKPKWLVEEVVETANNMKRTYS